MGKPRITNHRSADVLVRGFHFLLLAALKLLCVGGFMLMLTGCTVITYDRVFPKLTWYWSAEAKAQRAERNPIPTNWETNFPSK